MNVMREIVAEKCNLEKFELSGNWLGFWDKFEKINFFFGERAGLHRAAVADRTLDWVLNGIQRRRPVGYDGQHRQKYGIVPASVMPRRRSPATRLS